MISNVDPEILNGFVREVESYLPKVLESLDQYRSDPERVDGLEEAHRMVHCIKGAGATIGLMALSGLAQYSEDTLEEILNGELRWSEDAAGALAVATNHIGDYLHQMVAGELSPEPIISDMVRTFRRLHQLPPEGDDAEIARLLALAGDAGEAAEPEVAPPDEADLFALIETEERPAPPQLVAPPRAPENSLMQTLDEVTLDEDLWSAFQEEAAEHFGKMVECLSLLENGEDLDALKALRRSAHQLKGASGVVGMRQTSRLNANMQKVLDTILEGEASWSADLLPVFQSTFEVVLESVGGRGVGANLADRAQILQSEFDQLKLSGPRPAAARPAASPAPAAEREAKPAAKPEVRMGDAVDHVEAGDDLWDAFHQEAEEHLHGIGELLRAAERQTPDAELIQSLRRSVHTLKGACGIVGMRLTSSVAHRMEDLLDAFYEGRVTFHSHHAPLLFATYDLLVDAVAHRGLTADQQATAREIFAGYETALRDGRSEPKEDRRTAEEPRRPVSEPLPMAAEHDANRKGAQFVRAPLERVDDLVRLVSELVIHRSRFEQYLGSYTHEVNELQLSTERLNRISRRLQSDYEAAALQEANRRMTFSLAGGRGLSGAEAQDWDALEFDRYTEFHLLSRDLAETTSDVTNAGSRLNELVADFDSYLNRLGTLTGEVEDRLMRLRMLPLRNLSQRLHRTVRVTAERRNKLVDLVIEGESVELDKTVLEEMAGPIDHLLRNAVDHGIEPTERRRSAGKPERGTILLRAYHEGTQVVLQLRDDGGGLDLNRLRDAAVRMGYVSPDDAASLSDQELYSLIFMPGFSTAGEVSEVSGRGVGLDVVKATVNRMKGTFSVSSERGKGTLFTIRLPMTLALTRVVLVKSVNETYAIPLAAVSQILRIEPEQLERVGRKPVLRLSGKIVPTMHLAEVVGQQLPPDANLTRLKAVVLNIGDQRLALMVDTVVEAREVVVKSMGGLLTRVHAVTGATIMGDGAVVLILNPNDMMHQQHAVAPQVRLRAPAAPAKPQGEAFEVLIVDDSPSVRRVLSSLVRNVGWNPHSAKDGMEALEMLHSSATRPDVVLLDIEMPRMDGYELTAALRGMPQYRNTPIVMLTSRAGEKHRKRAFELGATDYMVKPYQDEELLGTVRRVVRQSRGVLA